MSRAKRPAYETSDLPFGIALGGIAGVALLVGAALIVVALADAFLGLGGTVQPAATAPSPSVFTDEGVQRRALERAAAERFAERLPIEEAMRRQARLGWPDGEEGGSP